MKKINNFFITILVFFLLTITSLKANEIYIVNKVNNQLITNIDIENEKKYLALLNPNIKKLKEKELFYLSKNSLIREKIKEIEIKKYYNLDNDYPFVKNLINTIKVVGNMNKNAIIWR